MVARAPPAVTIPATELMRSFDSYARRVTHDELNGHLHRGARLQPLHVALAARANRPPQA